MFLVINGLEWFSKGGWAMYPLALISLYTVFVILNRLYFFSRFIPETDNELENVLRGTALLPERLNGELAPLLARGMHEGRIDRRRAELAVEQELLEGMQFLNSLDTVTQVAPMFGLIGTVTGMVQTFRTVAELQGQVNPSVLAGGIWEALLTTVAGLMIAIPAVIAFRFFRSRLLRWQNHLNTVVDDCMKITAERGPLRIPATEGGEG
ncbi:MotA/TolQ/ExbB proton channel family protein [bacterium]|nr:MotA/TolQ/ExbB proton channel family protein [bacterium]